MGRRDFNERIRRIEKGQTRGPADMQDRRGGGFLFPILLLVFFAALGSFGRVLVSVRCCAVRWLSFFPTYARSVC